MKFAVLGGDERSAILCDLLCADGHKLRCFALEKAELCPEAVKTGCLQSCVYGADCVVLPVPAEKSGLLNAPFSGEKLALPDIISALWPGQLVCGGKLGSEICRQAQSANIFLSDIMKLPEFTVGNAVLTAEGALEILLGAGRSSLWKSRVLITGFGRIAKLLALRLRALGALVCIAARGEQDRAMAKALGCEAVSIDRLEAKIGDYPYIVNTVPARVISDAALCCVSSGAVLLELASLPGGFDRNLAENIGIKTISAPGLPGKCAPYTAAELVKQALYQSIKDQEE